jgi:hypothetical protein
MISESDKQAMEYFINLAVSGRHAPADSPGDYAFHLAQAILLDAKGLVGDETALRGAAMFVSAAAHCPVAIATLFD